MRVVSVIAILKTESDGRNTWVGWTLDEQPVPCGLRSSRLDALDLEDGSEQRWLLAASNAVGFFDSSALEDLENGERRRCGIAKLTDEEVAALGLSRE